VPCWIRSFRDFGWDGEDLRNGLKVQISHPVTFPVGLGKGRGVPGKNSHNGTIGGPDSETFLEMCNSENCITFNSLFNK
jgi:hypothetical protein